MVNWIRRILRKVVCRASLQSVGRLDIAIDLGSSAFRVLSSNGFQLQENLLDELDSVMSGGIVADIDHASRVLQRVLARSRRSGFRASRVVISHPTDVTARERDDFLIVARNAGAGRIATFPEPLAAAVGSDIDIGSCYAQMILDIGHGVIDGVILREGQILANKTVRVGCEELLRATIDRAAELGGRVSNEEAQDLLWRSVRDQLTEGTTPNRSSTKFTMDHAQLKDVLNRWLDLVAAVPLELFREAPDEVAAEVVESGLWITGGGALLPEVGPVIARVTGLDVQKVRDPLSAVVLGNRSLLETADRFGSWV